MASSSDSLWCKPDSLDPYPLPGWLQPNPGSRQNSGHPSASVDSNHAERDKHLRGSDFLDVAKYPEARFKGISYKPTGAGKATLTGELTLRGITKVVTLDVTEIGQGRDPWGGYRRGFEGTTKLKLKDYGIPKDLGPASAEVAMTLSVEGIREVVSIRP